VRPLAVVSWVLGLLVCLSAASRLWGSASLADYPALTRLFSASSALVALTAASVAVRDPKTGTVLSLCLGALAIWFVLELPMGALLGAVLLTLAAVALFARPWPNRIVMSRCIALAGIAVAVASALGF
jgi:hypothetical protein